MHRLRWFILLTFFFPRISFAQHSTPATPTDIAIHAGRVLDVRTGKYATNQIIWVQGERIKAIGSAGEIEKQLPTEVKTLDLSRYTLLPGLIDCHTHLTMRPIDAGPAGYHVSYPRQALEHFQLKCLHFIARFLKPDLSEIQWPVKA
jgi:hypothetical protein